MQRLRVLTFNIAHGRGLTPIQGLTMGRKLRANLRKIAKLITELSPDVVALQEIDQHSRWAGNFDHLEYLQIHTGYPYSIFGINNRRAGLLNLNYGNAFLSKHPIVESGDWHMLPIVCGDMNNQAHLPDATAELMRYFLLHGEYTLHPKDGRTFPSPFPSRGLDFIFLPPGCENVKCEVVPTMISDHRPVWAEFTLRKDRKTDFAPRGILSQT